MRYRLVVALLLTSITVFGQGIPEKPALRDQRLVNDFSGTTLSRGEVDRLERKLRIYNDSTSTQVVIMIVESLNGYEVADFAQRTAQEWGIGQRGKDNGVLILVALKERQMNINTGYGMEGVIPDAAAFRIIEDQMKPNFRSNNFYRGLDEATDVIFKLASGEYTADQVIRGRRSNSSSDGERGFPFGFLFILFFFIIPALLGRRRSRNSIGRRSFPWWIFLLGNGGSGRRNDWDNFRGGGGGFGGGSGFGGGGFGGFGGGSFGGGGASGSW